MDGRATRDGSWCQPPDFYKMAIGKKRVAEFESEEMEPKEEKKRKRIRVEGPSDKPVIKKVPKQKARAQLNPISTSIYSSIRHLIPNQSNKVGSEHNLATAFTQPIWKVFQKNMPRPPKATQSQEKPSLTNLKPRIWTSVGHLTLSLTRS